MKKIGVVIMFLVLFVLCNQTSAKAQYQSKGFWGGVELDYGLTLSDRGTGYKNKFGGHTKMQMVSFRTVMGYYLAPYISLGTGVGLSTYSKPRLNAIPIFLDARIHPISNVNENFYVNLNVGTFLGDNQKSIDSKVFYEVSVGYKLFDFGSCNLAPALGYQFYRYRTDGLDIQTGEKSSFSQKKRTLFFRLSLTY